MFLTYLQQIDKKIADSCAVIYHSDSNKLIYRLAIVFLGNQFQSAISQQ